MALSRAALLSLFVGAALVAAPSAQLWAEAEAGVAATQAIVDVSYGPKALA